MKKECIKCHVEKDEEEGFYKSGCHKSGYNNICRLCCRESFKKGRIGRKNRALPKMKNKEWKEIENVLHNINKAMR